MTPPDWWTAVDEDGKPAQPGERTPERDESDALIGPVGRRDFLKAVGFGAAAVAVASCETPVRYALPLVHGDERVVPGSAVWFASSCGGCAASCGVLLKTRDGRPIKVEGNPDHPVNGHPARDGEVSRVGGLCALGQASSMALYDSSRPLEPRLDGHAATWSAVDERVRAGLDQARAAGREILLLTGPIASPTTRLAIQRFANRNGATHLVLDPLGPSAIADAHGVSHGVAAIPVERLDRAELVVSFGADLLQSGHSPVEHQRLWAVAHRPDRRAQRMGRWIQIEGRLSTTGAYADERLRATPGGFPVLLAELLRRVAPDAPALAPVLAALPRGQAELAPEVLDSLAGQLREKRGKALVVCDSTDTSTQLLVNALNEALGAYGELLDLAQPRRWTLGRPSRFAAALESMAAGRVGAVLVWGANPLHDWPDPSAARAAFERVPLRISLDDRRSETAAACPVLAPSPHFLEGWSDAEPRHGVLSLQQPALRALGRTRSAQESLLRWSGEDATWLDWLRRSWARNVFPRQRASAVFTTFWDAVLERGAAEIAVGTWEAPDGTEPAYGDRAAATGPLAAGGAPGEAPATAAFDGAATARALGQAAPRAADGSGLELLVHVSATVRSGNDANNPWLQELPDPISKVSWTNHASLSPRTAGRLGVRDGDVVVLSASGRTLELPAVVQPGQHDRVVSVAAGYGRRVAGPVAEGVGGNAMTLLAASDAGLPSSGIDVAVRPAGRSVTLGRAQVESGLHERTHLRSTTFSALLADPRAGNPREGRHLTLWPGHRYEGHRWGMAIDLSACTGCSACVVGCQVENNVPVVGPEELARNREMSWLHIDRYYGGEDPDAPQVLHQPMLCQHCENAPCETVCPVLATVHSSEGLNQQVYNRCIGTRYCANNCPYKARRFNWFDYPHQDETARLALNPDVVVRSRGVMEKCSFCVQRIQDAKWAARREGRAFADGDVQPACAQSCPSRAIVFGDLHDPRSEVSRLVHGSRAYRALHEINVLPSVSYLTRVKNPGEET